MRCTGSTQSWTMSRSRPSVLDVARRAGVVGRTVYDLIVGLAAADVGAMLLSLDRRAVPTYEAAGTGHELLGS